MPKAVNIALKIVAAIVVAAIVFVLGYVIYVSANYYRIEDHAELEVENAQSATLEAGATYTAATYNIGFGAYTPDYTFFMDEGVMADGTYVVGEHSKAVSAESVQSCIAGDIDLLTSIDADFTLLQEVDVDSTRSFGINQAQAMKSAFSSEASVFASNFHSVFLLYPIPDFHGAVQSGLLTLSKYAIESAERRSYPVSDAFPDKFFDLDRCFEVMRVPVSNGRQLVLINSHMSAYDTGGKVREQQIALLREVLEQEAAAGNYVICGGDWNHAICGEEGYHLNGQQDPAWVSWLTEEDVPEGFSVVTPTNVSEVSTCRSSEIPYEKGVNFEATIDGFIVSSKVSASAENIDAGYQYSDHNPVKLTFSLSE